MGSTNCKRDGCANIAVKGGVCVAHGAKTKRCSQEGCANGAVKGGVCVTHGAKKKVKRCSQEGCANGAIKGGVCVTHGARVRRCSQEGCANKIQKGGLCRRHGAYSIVAVATAQDRAAQPPHPAAGYHETTVVVASAITGGGRGEIEIDTRNLQADVSCTAAPRSPSLRPFIMAPNFPEDDDEEIIGAWIWRSSRMARLVAANNTEEASS